MDLEPEPGGLPPGYPKEYQREEVLRDGRRVFIRPILPGDAPEPSQWPLFANQVKRNEAPG